MDEGGRKADLKLVLVGHAAVGKTAIVTRLVKGTGTLHESQQNTPKQHINTHLFFYCFLRYMRSTWYPIPIRLLGKPVVWSF